MKHSLLFSILLFFSIATVAQTRITAPQVTCDGTADAVAGIYTDHTKTKYATNILKGTSTEKTVMMKTLTAIEKLEEASRKNFTLTGCVARVSFATSAGNSIFGKNIYKSYGYQLGVYPYVCHVTEHLPKIVDEYRTVFRVDINPNIFIGTNAGGTGEFSVTGNIRYEAPKEAKLGANFEQNKIANPSNVSKYISEANMLEGRSSNYKNKHSDFLKIINGESFTEN